MGEPGDPSPYIKVSIPTRRWLDRLVADREAELRRDVTMAEMMEVIRTVYDTVMNNHPEEDDQS